MHPSLRPARGLALLTALAMCVMALPLEAQAPPRPAPQRPAPQRARPAPPRAPAPAPQATNPAEAERPPAPPAPQDVRFRTVYTNGDRRTESVTYLKGVRERYEFQDMVLLKQHDQNRTVQISEAARMYLIVPDGQVPAPAAVPAASPKQPGVVALAATIVDTGERKEVFGRQARRVRTVIDRQPAPGACEPERQRIETDGWYIDAPASLATQAPPDRATPASAECADRIQATTQGDPKALGFPVSYTTTVTTDGGSPAVVSMEVTELEVTSLDAALFEVPQGLNAAVDLRDMSKALSDASEASLVASSAAPPPAIEAPRTPGVVRIGVPEFTNSTPQQVDGRALRARLIAALADAKLEAQPMAAGPPADVQKRAAELGYDFVLLADVSELKVSKPGRLGGLVRAASGVAGTGLGGPAAGVAGAAAGAAAAPRENTESTIAVKLVQPDGKQRLSTTTRGKDGSGFTLKTGLGLARFAGTMYIGLFMGPTMFSRLNAMGLANLGGLGMLGTPALYQLQMGGLAGAGQGMGIDATAGAASYLMQQAMAMNDARGLVGIPGQGPSFDESLGEALDGAARAVAKALQK